jgi:hypothetical protein
MTVKQHGPDDDFRPVKDVRPRCTPRCEEVFFGGSFANGLVPATLGSQASVRVSQTKRHLFALKRRLPEGKIRPSECKQKTGV